MSGRHEAKLRRERRSAHEMLRGALATKHSIREDQVEDMLEALPYSTIPELADLVEVLEAVRKVYGERPVPPAYEEEYDL